jgi:hypothetical protein
MGSESNGEPYIELYVSSEVLASKLQQGVIETIDEYDTTVYDVSDSNPHIHTRMLDATPTTIALDGEYEIERWEGITSADDIRNVLDKW